LRIFVVEMRVLVRVQVEVVVRLWLERIILSARGSIRLLGSLVRCVVGLAVSPRIVARGFRVVSDLGLGEGEQRCGVDVGRAGGFCDDGGAGVLDALARQNVQARSDSFDRRLGEATEEFLGRHVAKVSVGTDGVAGDPGGKTAIAMAERAGEDIGERLARGDAQAFDVVAEASVLGDRLNKFCAGCMPEERFGKTRVLRSCRWTYLSPLSGPGAYRARPKRTRFGPAGLRPRAEVQSMSRPRPRRLRIR